MIRIQGLKYAIGNFSMDVDFEIKDNEYFVLLGMTGSGKTLLLENLCGLRDLFAGEVNIGRRRVTLEEPRKRKIGYVPQDGALFEHLTVSRNIAFSLAVQRRPKEEQKKEAGRIADLLGISHLLERPIRGLSGGERQRVALGRALASRPEVLLLDEPVSALDEYTRESVCLELKRIQRTLKLSVIHVCHSFEEARLVADRIGIMHNGRIIQAGSGDELINAPAFLQVARIVGLKNIFIGQAVSEGNQDFIRLPGLTLEGPKAEGTVTFIVHTDRIRISDKTHEKGMNIVTGKIKHIQHNGVALRFQIDGPLALTFYLMPDDARNQNLAEGREISLEFPESAIHIIT